MSHFNVTIRIKYEYHRDSIFIKIVFESSTKFVLALNNKIRNHVLFAFVFEGQKPIICLSRINNEYKLDEKPQIAIVLTLTIGRKPRWLKDREVRKKMLIKCGKLTTSMMQTTFFHQLETSGTWNIFLIFVLKQK